MPQPAQVKQASLANSYYTNTMSPGASKNICFDIDAVGAYRVGLSPTGASTAAPCQFQVTSFMGGLSAVTPALAA